MPIGIQRLNAPKPQPSSQIVFIKPLPGPDSHYAQDFLERIAAICHPIMKANHLSIMTLEEHEPNPEFIGRNFNAGEIIQLVLKAPYSGHWLSFRSVQMVMMHELAHCQQMNHGRGFWKVNNQFKGELRELWAKKYTGDGLWGRGQTLLSGQYDTGNNLENEIMPANLCGGTFRSRRRKRGRGAGAAGAHGRGETFAEAKQRRIAKKFGVNGATLGGDEETRVKLEYGQKVKGKPRVANSARGRELRVAAAAARLGQQKTEDAKKEEDKANDETNIDNKSETEDENYEEVEDGVQAIDLDGSQMVDGKGQDMVRVCSDEDQNDARVKEEMDELQELNNFRQDMRTHQTNSTLETNKRNDQHPESYEGQQYQSPKGLPAELSLGLVTKSSEANIQGGEKGPKGPRDVTTTFPAPACEHDRKSLGQVEAQKASNAALQEVRSAAIDDTTPAGPQLRGHIDSYNNICFPSPSRKTDHSTTANNMPHQLPTSTSSGNCGLGLKDYSFLDTVAAQKPDPSCPICSTPNEPTSVLCIGCSHVLDTSKVTGYWRCLSDACQGSQYINAADCGVCGACGARK